MDKRLLATVMGTGLIALLDTPKDPLVNRLHRIVDGRTPKYVSFNYPHADETLMKAQLALAVLYANRGDKFASHQHFREAQQELTSMSRVEEHRREHSYFSINDYANILASERKRDSKLQRYENAMHEIARRIGFDSGDKIIYLLPHLVRENKIKYALKS